MKIEPELKFDEPRLLGPIESKQEDTALTLELSSLQLQIDNYLDGQPGTSEPSGRPSNCLSLAQDSEPDSARYVCEGIPTKKLARSAFEEEKEGAVQHEHDMLLWKRGKENAAVFRRVGLLVAGELYRGSTGHASWMTESIC